MMLRPDLDRAARLALLAALFNLTPFTLISLGAATAVAAPGTGEPTAMTADPIQTAETSPPVAAHRDGLHDFDFLIGHWKVRLRKLLHPLTGSTTWVEYTGTSATRKIWDDRANTEEFDVDSPENNLHIRAQTLRLYNPDSRQWSIYLVNAAKGVLSMPPVIGQFTDGHGEFYDQEDFGGRSIFVRYEWFNISPVSARMVQSFSADGAKSWEANWICELSREQP